MIVQTESEAWSLLESVLPGTPEAEQAIADVRAFLTEYSPTLDWGERRFADNLRRRCDELAGQALRGLFS